jgi:hypothetical protein
MNGNQTVRQIHLGVGLRLISTIDINDWHCWQMNAGRGFGSSLGIATCKTHCTIFNSRFALPWRKP